MSKRTDAEIAREALRRWKRGRKWVLAFARVCASAAACDDAGTLVGREP